MLPRRAVSLALLLGAMLLGMGGFAWAQKIETPGTACPTTIARFWEQASLCPGASSTWQRPAFQFGASTKSDL